MPAYHTSARSTAQAFDVGMQQIAGGFANVLLDTHEAFRANRIVTGEVAHVQAARIALVARREAEAAERERVANARAAVLPRRYASRHA